MAYKGWTKGSSKIKCKNCGASVIRRSNEKFCKECRAILFRKKTQEEIDEIRSAASIKAMKKIYGENHITGKQKHAEVDKIAIERIDDQHPGFKSSLLTLKSLFRNT